MAGLGTYARAAAGLEALARQVRDHALAWDPHAREAWTEGLAALRALVLRAPSWEANDDRQALALAERFEQVMTGRPARATAPAPAALTPGVRAFIARESALIAGSLEQASRALAPIPPATALAGVLERMQSLRGLGASAELSPLPELLDAMEVATRALLSDAPAPPNIAAVFADAAHALSAMARSIADAGQVLAPPELAVIAQRLLDAYGSEADVVAMAALSPDGSDAIVQIGTPPSALPEADPVPVELVSVGAESLKKEDHLARPVSPVARDLRLFVLHRTLAAMPSRTATGRFLAPLAAAISAAISNHVATDRPDAFVAMVRGCGRFLVEAGGINDRIAITRRRDAIATSLVMVGLGAPAGGFEQKAATVIPSEVSRTATNAVEEPEPPVLPPAPEMPQFPTHDEPEIVSIGSLAPDAASDTSDIVPIASLAHDDDSDVVTIESLAHEDEADVVSIESLAPSDDPDVVPIESLAPDLISPEPVVPVIPVQAPGVPTRLEQAFVKRRALALTTPENVASLSGLIAAEIVPVSTLLYRGQAALSRAEEVRLELTALLAEPAISIDRLRPHVIELLDLIPLARDAA